MEKEIRKQGRTGVEVLIDQDKQNKRLLFILNEIDKILIKEGEDFIKKHETIAMRKRPEWESAIRYFYIDLKKRIEKLLNEKQETQNFIHEIYGVKVRTNPYVPEGEIWIGTDKTKKILKVGKTT